MSIRSIIILIAALTLLLGIIRGCINVKNRAEKEQIRLLKENISYKKELLQQRDENNRMQTVVNSYKTTLANLEADSDAEIVELRNEVRRLKNLHSITRANYQVEGTFTAAVENTDTTDSEKPYQRIFKFQDHYLSITGNLTADSITGHYTYQDQFTIKKEYKSRGFFKQPELLVSAYPENPAASFPDLMDITIQPNKKKWYQTRIAAFSIGLIAGAILVHNR